MRQGFTDRVMTFLRDNPSRWINAIELEPIGGRQAWRTRVSEARRRFEAAGEGTIKNVVIRQTDIGVASTATYAKSLYMFVPTPTAAPRAPHNLNGWSLQ